MKKLILVLTIALYCVSVKGQTLKVNDDEKIVNVKLFDNTYPNFYLNREKVFVAGISYTHRYQALDKKYEIVISAYQKEKAENGSKLIYLKFNPSTLDELKYYQNIFEKREYNNVKFNGISIINRGGNSEVSAQSITVMFNKRIIDINKRPFQYR